MAKDSHIILGTTLLTSHKRVTQNIAMQSDILQRLSTLIYLLIQLYIFRILNYCIF